MPSESLLAVHRQQRNYRFLLVAGYLKAVRVDPAFSGDYMCEVALPNQEIAFVYNKEILQKLTDIIPQATAISIQEALYSNDAQRLQKEMHKLLLQSASCYDTARDNFYHGFVLGLCAMMDNRYYISSNGESGEGRYDLQLLPKSANMPGILIELKAAGNFSGDKLKQLSEKFFRKCLNESHGEMEMPNFSKKNFKVRFQEFIKTFPVILSTTYALRLSIPQNYLLDYVIIV